jgi:rhamnosyltransferase
MSPSSQPLVSVVIPTLNAGKRLGRLLERLKSQQVPGTIEIIVVDSGSRDDTPNIASAAGAQVLAIPRRQFNHGRTRNYAIELSKGEFVALTVQDALPTDEYWLARLLAPLLERAEVAGSYGLQVASPDAGLLARARSALWCEARQAHVIKSLDTPEQFSKLLPNQRWELIEFDNVTSCIRRRVWEEIPFPERKYGEDMAWAKEVLLRGYSIAFVPAAQVWHSHERGWLYELRRAYVDGGARVELVNWPSAGFILSDLLLALRRMLFFFTTKRFNSMVRPEEICNFLQAEIDRYEKLASIKFFDRYVEALKFAWALTNKALPMLPEGKFPEGTWIHLFRFALIAVIGEELGATAATLRHSSGRNFVWRFLDAILGRGV